MVYVKCYIQCCQCGVDQYGKGVLVLVLGGDQCYCEYGEVQCVGQYVVYLFVLGFGIFEWLVGESCVGVCYFMCLGWLGGFVVVGGLVWIGQICVG